MVAKRLTAKKLDKEIRDAVRDGGDAIRDGDGLFLLVKANGSASWMFRFQLRGRRRDMGLGSYPGTPLAEARDLADAARQLLKRGADPLDARSTQVREATSTIRDTRFVTLAAAYIASHRAGWRNAKHAEQWTNTLKTYAEPTIGELPVAEVTTAHLQTILDPIWYTKTETASRVRNRIELILDAARAQGLRDGENPARWRGHLATLYPPRSRVRPVRHHPAVPWQELPALWARLDTRTGDSLIALRLLILTAMRTDSAIGARWREFDLDAATWTCPGERMKGGIQHTVPLSRQAVELLRTWREVAVQTAAAERATDGIGGRFLFPGLKPGRHISNMTTLKALRSFGVNATVHGFRSTFRDWAGEATHYPRDVCEMALAHAIDNKAEAAYRRGDMLAKRRALMQDWADYATGTKSEPQPAADAATE
jgi:integrase